MTAVARRTRRRPDMRRAVILFPSGLTLGNLFFGVFAIIAASRLEFVAAGVYVLLGGICDALDGRVARATNAGTEFGEELDSLVDAITFGLAPGMIMYFAVLNRSGWDWVWVFVFAACAVLRLARFNIEQAGSAKTYFQGLPSPAAGITLASYYWFSQSSLYTYGAIADLKWHVLLRYLMAMLSFLMISNVPYPVFPRTGFRSLRAVGATLLLIGSVVLLATRRLEFFFPCALIYVAWGLLRWVLSGLFERRQPTIPYDLSEGEDDEEEEDDDEFGLDSEVHATRRSHRIAHTSAPERSGRGARGEHAEVAERAESQRSRTERSATRATAERDPDRSRRPKESERPRREERPRDKERSRRPEKPPREPRVAAPASATAVAVAPVDQPPATGVDAITLGEPETASLPATAHAPVGTAAEGPETAADAAAPARKRKRRRRRGERKDRPSAGDTTDTGRDAGSDEADSAEGEDREPEIGDRSAREPSAMAEPSPAPLLLPPPSSGPEHTE